MLFIWNIAFIKLSSCSDSKLLFDHDKLTSILQRIKWKLRGLQILIKYFNGITTFVFKCGTGDRGVRDG